MRWITGVVLLLAGPCAHPRSPASETAPRLSTVFTVSRAVGAEDPRGCARRVVFDMNDVAGGAPAPASLCLASVKAADEAPEGAWFWLDGTLEATLPNGTALFVLKIRASDVDPEATGRTMRVAYWRGSLDRERSTGVYRGRAGGLSGGGELQFEKDGARTDLLLSMELDGAGHREAAGPARYYALRQATLRPGTPPCRFQLEHAVAGLAGAADTRGGFCTMAVEGKPGDPGWMLITGKLTLGDAVIDLRSREQRDPEDASLRRLVWHGTVVGGGTLFGLGTFRTVDPEQVELDVLLRLDQGARAASH